eukprot:PhF_6_TR8667/c0_g1_i1/m.13557
MKSRPYWIMVCALVFLALYYCIRRFDIRFVRDISTSSSAMNVSRDEFDVFDEHRLRLAFPLATRPPPPVKTTSQQHKRTRSRENRTKNKNLDTEMDGLPLFNRQYLHLQLQDVYVSCSIQDRPILDCDAPAKFEFSGSVNSTLHSLNAELWSLWNGMSVIPGGVDITRPKMKKIPKRSPNNNNNVFIVPNLYNVIFLPSYGGENSQDEINAFSDITVPFAHTLQWVVNTFDRSTVRVLSWNVNAMATTHPLDGFRSFTKLMMNYEQVEFIKIPSAARYVFLPGLRVMQKIHANEIGRTHDAGMYLRKIALDPRFKLMSSTPTKLLFYQRRDETARKTNSLAVLADEGFVEIKKLPISSLKAMIRLISSAKMLVVVGGVIDMYLYFAAHEATIFHVMPCTDRPAFRGVSYFRQHWSSRYPVALTKVKLYDAKCNSFAYGCPTSEETRSCWMFRIPEGVMGLVVKDIHDTMKMNQRRPNVAR